MLARLTVLLALAQDHEPVAPSPFDRVVELEFVSEPRTVAHRVEFSGTLHVWTRSELDLSLSAEHAGELVEQDNDPDGGDIAYLRLDVEPGQELAITVTGAEDSASGVLELHLIAQHETDGTLAAARAAEDALEEAAQLLGSGESDAARERLIEIQREILAQEGADHSRAIPKVVYMLARKLYRLGELEGCRAGLEAVLLSHERTLPAVHREILSARSTLAVILEEMGDLAGAVALHQAVLAARESYLPEDHRSIQRARARLAYTLYSTGDLAGARTLQQEALAAYERSLPEDHADLLRLRVNLANTLLDLGEFAAAHALLEAVVAARERSLPADHPDLLNSQLNLAISLSSMGNLAGARALGEAVVAGYERSLPGDHPDLLRSQANLANTLDRLGDITAARALREMVVAARERQLPADHPKLLDARFHLANSMHAIGDLAGARALLETVHDAYMRNPPADHLDLTMVRGNLATTIQEMGDHDGARQLHEAVLETCERTLPPDHPDLQIARATLANTLRHLGDLAGAREMHEAVILAYRSSLPADHPELLRAQRNMATVLYQMGDLVGARALQEAVLLARERSFPADHPSVLVSRHDVALSRHGLGDVDGVRELLPALADGMKARILGALALAPRRAIGVVSHESERLAVVLFLSEAGDLVFKKDAFELTETLRLVAGEAARSLARFGEDSELKPILTQAAAIRRELNDLVAGAERVDRTTAELSAELTRLSLERDRLEREATRQLTERGVVTQPVPVERLAATLLAGQVAVGYRRIARLFLDEASGVTAAGADHVLAHVLTSEGELTRIDVGPAAELEALASTWRAAIGAPILTGTRLRGRVVEMAADPREDDAGDELDAGRRLRARLLDPILDAVDAETERLFVCADDLLFSIPLDALPLDTSGRIGDRVTIVNEVSFARLLAEAQGTERGAASLLSLGGVDYGAQGLAPAGRLESSVALSGTRGAGSTVFQDLPQTGHEAEAIVELFERSLDLNATLLTGEQTTKAALFEAAAGRQFVHLATHGWFAPESLRSSADSSSSRPGFARMGMQERISGLAPMTLCGLALAGANRGSDARGRVAGILTAEELCSLDLSQCELAVLSACETNVGIRRAGQGIQSLQAALYAAGARTSITSLWKVDDAATRRLMEAFYTNLWIEGMGKAEALWEAKKALRADGDPPAHWAGWVLTGDPD